MIGPLVYGYGEANGSGWYIDNGAGYAFVHNPFFHNLIRILVDMALLLALQMQVKVSETFSYFSKTLNITRMWLLFSVVHIILSGIIVLPLLQKV